MHKIVLSVLLFGILICLTVSGEEVLPGDLHAMPVLIQIPSGHSSFPPAAALPGRNVIAQKAWVVQVI
jgi:hypothetical protein